MGRLSQLPMDYKLARLSIPEPNSGCWLWLGAVNGAGYGSIGSGGNRKYGARTLGAHVAAWRCEHGDVPDGLHVCHHCDNKLCVNPGHLYVATTQQNTRDAVERGRFKRGTQRRNARFTDEQVREIKRGAARGVSLNELGRRFGVNHAHIRKIARDEIWGHVAP